MLIVSPTPTVTRLTQTLSGVNANSANTDVGSFVGLPAKYIIRGLTFYDKSGSIVLATFSLFTGAGGTGTALVSAFLVNALTAASAIVDATLAVGATTAYQTAATLYLRNITAAGGAATVSCMLEIQVVT